MRISRKLVVKMETLGELTTSDLASVAGGTVSNVVAPCPTRNFPDPVCDFISRAVQPCLTENC